MGIQLRTGVTCSSGKVAFSDDLFDSIELNLEDFRRIIVSDKTVIQYKLFQGH